MSDHFRRHLRLRDKARDALVDLFSCGPHYGMTHNAMLERREKIRETVKKSPHWVRSYLDGYWDALQANAYRHDLVYGGMFDGRFLSTHSDRPDYYEKHGVEPSAFSTMVDNNRHAVGHYWRSN